MARGIGACDAVIRSRIAGLDPAIHREQRLLSCEDRWMPGSSPLHPIFGSAGPAEHTRPPRQGFEAIAPSRRAARGQQEPPMKLPRTVGLAVAVPLVAATVAALA